MIHESEFSTTSPERAAKREQATRDLAACYARVFLGTEDGKRVLADLRAKFGLNRLVFHPGNGGRFDTVAAALIEGERRVMADIESALRLGAPLNANTSKEQTA